MTEFTASTERIRSTADQVRSRAEGIDGELSALRGQVHDLGTEWLGPAAAQFQALYDQWAHQAQNLNTTLHEIADEMHRAAANYEDVEHHNVIGMGPA